MATRIAIDTATEQVIDALVNSGRFASPEEVLREGVRLVQEQEDADVDMDTLDSSTRQAVAEGLADIEAGRTVDAEIVLARIQERYADWPRAAE